LVTNWLNLFEVVVITLKEDKDKVLKLMSYLDDDALEFYANKIAPNLSTLTWAETRGLMEKRFSSSTISPIIAATRRRLTKADTVKSYFDDKMASLEKTGLSEEHIVDQLTEGLPDSYKSHLYTARIKDTLEWLSIVSKLEADLEPKSFKSHKSSQSNHCTIAHCDESKSSSREKNFSNKPEQSRPPNKVFKKSDKPRTPCRYCLKLGNKEWHWHKDCPN
jgi:hypothetical protein